MHNICRHMLYCKIFLAHFKIFEDRRSSCCWWLPMLMSDSKNSWVVSWDVIICPRSPLITDHWSSSIALSNLQEKGCRHLKQWNRQIPFTKSLILNISKVFFAKLPHFFTLQPLCWCTMKCWLVWNVRIKFRGALVILV